MRRMEREVGPLRFEVHSCDSQMLKQVLAWKSQQYRRSGWKDLFATRWGRALVERIHQVQSPSFAGMLSLLFAGTQLVKAVGLPSCPIMKRVEDHRGSAAVCCGPPRPYVRSTGFWSTCSTGWST